MRHERTPVPAAGMRGDDAEVSQKGSFGSFGSSVSVMATAGVLRRKAGRNLNSGLERKNKRDFFFFLEKRVFEGEQTEGCVSVRGGGSAGEGRVVERRLRCATEQNLSRSLSSAITVETSLFLSQPPPSFSCLATPSQGKRQSGRLGGGGGGGAREGEVESPTPSCQRRSEETSGAICCAFQLPLLALAHSPSRFFSPVC